MDSGIVETCGMHGEIINALKDFVKGTSRKNTSWRDSITISLSYDLLKIVQTGSKVQSAFQ
jgi:hypothetical protein